jgi:hypothetical protein
LNKKDRDDHGLFLFTIWLLLAATAGATAAACTGIFCAAVTVTFAMASAGTTTTTFCIGAADCKPCTMLGVVYKINRGITEIVNGNFIHDDFYAVGFKSCVDIAEVIVEGHSKIHTTTSAACDVHAKGESIEIALGENVFNSLACCWG